MSSRSPAPISTMDQRRGSAIASDGWGGVVALPAQRLRRVRLYALSARPATLRAFSECRGSAMRSGGHAIARVPACATYKVRSHAEPKT
ncbi:hypothetical protein XHV734_5071 [Xanthomonas hortorum pv. vitians]|nr:hypothetical protein XHV734_5071 [Xanthomonas hortorum pv. vitians]